jgi:hypothetical protein
MNRFPYRPLVSITLVTSILLAGACDFGSKSSSPQEVSLPAPKVLEPGVEEPTQEERNITRQVESLRRLDAEQPKITPDPRYAVLHVENDNLDFDQSEEQIVVMKLKDNPDAPLRVGVVDFDSVRNQYTMTWSEDTNATIYRTFKLTLADIVGDHNLEIVCAGINTAGERTLDLYRKTLAPNGVGLYYENICSIVADGSIEIQEHERTPAYKLGQKNGISFPIVAFSHDKDSENMMDLVKREYYWKYQENRYILGRTEKIPGEDIEEQQLQELFTQGSSAFESFLNDPWFRLTRSGDDGETTQDIIFFDLDQRQISFYSEEVQEIYDWNTTHRSRIPNSVFISGHNQLVPFIVKDIAVYVTSLDTVTIDVNDSDFQNESYQWDGKYYRVKGGSPFDSVEVDRDTPPFSAEDLSGEFISEEGNSVVFTYPSFVLTRENTVSTGGYILYRIGEDTILEFKILEKNRTLKETLTFSAVYSVEESGNTLVHSLILQAGIIGVNGFVARDIPPTVYQRIEVIEEDEADEGEPPSSEVEGTSPGTASEG